MTNEEAYALAKAIDDRERAMNDEIASDRAKLQMLCPHEHLRFCPDPAGNDSEWYCPTCRRFFTRDPRR